MSYLELEKGIPDFSKAVISLWFRVPMQTMIDVAENAIAENNKRAEFDAESDQYKYYVFPRFHRIVPLLVFGPIVDGYQIKSVPSEEISWTETIVGFSGCAYHTSSSVTVTDTTTVSYSQPAPYLPNPSFIGLEIDWSDNNNIKATVSGSLKVRLQLAKNDNGSGSLTLKEKITTSNWTQLDTVLWSTGDDCEPPPTDIAYDPLLNECVQDYVYPGDSSRKVHTTHEDVTDFFVKARGPEAIETRNIGDLKPDHWHHVLVSFDLDLPIAMTGKGHKVVADIPDCTAVGPGGGAGITVSDETIKAVTNPCKMWIALNDNNLTSAEFFDNYASVTGLGDNGIVTQSVYSAAASSLQIDLHQKTWGGRGLIHYRSEADDADLPNYQHRPKKLPSDKNPLGVPCTKALQAYNRHVEMAELQIFTGITLDTKKEDNRRAFISTSGKPAGSDKAEKLLKQKPIVMLHKSGNWIVGNNTGSTGTDLAGKPIPADDFKPIGGIKRYKPEPSLHGPQKPGDKKAP